MIARLWKPWFVYQPMQMLRRCRVALMPPTPGYNPLRTSWGMTVRADPTRTIGWSILTTGIYDLTVSEVLARLIDPGQIVVDGGANVGYMTVLAATAAGRTGKVISFEPHPQLFAVLKQNVAAAREQCEIADVEMHQAALGPRSGVAELLLPKEMGGNDGIARIAEAGDDSSAERIAVEVKSLDDVLGNRIASVMKLDVEGFEAQVLRGANRALEARRIRHVVFEEHQIETSDVVDIFRSLGYSVFAIGWSMRGLALQPVAAGRLANQYEAANYVATIDPADLAARCSARGWSILNNRWSHRPR